MGPSGAGKSTLLRAINRLIEPSSGEVYLDGEPTGSLDPLELRRRAGDVPRAFVVVALTVGPVATLGLLLALGVIPATARYLIPLGGMAIGNSMNAASLTLTRIRDDVRE